MQKKQSRYIKFLRQGLAFLGLRARVLIAISLTASVAMAGLELALSGVLVMFFASVHLLAPGTSVPSYLAFYSFSPVEIGSLLIAISIAKGIAQITIAQAGLAAGEAVSVRLRYLSIFEMLLIRPSRYISSSLVNVRIADVFPQATVCIQTIAQLSAAFIQCIGICFIMLGIAWRESLLAFGLLIVIGMFVSKINRRILFFAKKSPPINASLFFALERAVRNWILIRIFRTEVVERNRLSIDILNYSATMRKLTFLSNLNASLLPFFGMFAIAVLVYASQSLWLTAGASLVACLYLLTRLVQTISAAAGFLTLGLQNFYYLRQAMQFFFSFSESDRAQAFASKPRVSFTGKFHPPIIENTSKLVKIADQAQPPSILVDDVWFSYEEKEHLSVLKNMNLRVKGGDHVGIIGPSGSGKSTFLSLILGLLLPSKGRITLQEMPASEYVERYSSTIGYVGPDLFLIRGSLRDNLLFGNHRQVSDDEIKVALQFSRLDHVISKLPLGLDYCVEENGEGLSAGQKQRLGLARAFLRQAKLLILDEVSANLDEKTEREIAESIAALRGKCTVLIVSHRIGMLKFCDTTIDIVSGNEVRTHVG